MLRSGNTSKKHFPIIAFSSILFLTLALFLGVGWQSWHSHKDIVEIQGRDIKLQKLVGIIIHLDEVLTMSARMGAETGDLQWEKRYLRFEPQLDVAIKEAEKLTPDTFLVESAIQTDAANIKLVIIEKQAFELVRQGQNKAALALLFSEGYEEQKRIYAEGLEQITTSIQESVNDHIKAHRQQAFLTIVVVLITLPCLIFAWIYVLRLMNRYNIERRQMEERLRELSRAVEQSPCTIVITDIEGNIEYVNPKFTQLTGYTYKEAMGQNPRILKTNKTSPEKYECLWKTITSGKEWHGEFCNKKKNGDLYWESASISPVKNSEGSITHFVAVKEDITERKKMEEKLKLFNKYLEERVVERTEKLKKKNLKLLNEIVWREQAEEELRESNELKSRLIASSFDCIKIIDLQGNLLFMNKGGQKAFEIDDIELYLNKSWLDYWESEDKKAALGAISSAVNGGIGSFQGYSPTIKGNPKWWDVVISPIFGVDGKTERLLAVSRDITERKHAERRLAAQHAVTKVLSESATLKEALLGILSSMCSALEWDLGEVWLFDPKNNVLRCSEIWHIASVDVPDFKAVTRQSTFAPGVGLPGSVLSKAKPVWIADVVHDANFPRASVAEREGLHGAFGFPILVGREVLGTISIYSREIKEPDKELLDMVNDIGCRIGLFIRRNRAEEQIKASLTEKKVLLDEVHHRVKNNLQIISSLLDMSSMQTQNQETIKLFAESRNRVESMALIHSQLYESERFDEIDMQRHIQELSGNLLNIYSKEKTITIDIKSANVYLPVTLAVPCALVLNELISNSLKHAYRDGQQGMISISMQQSNDGAILLKVKDNGVGIPETIDIEMTKSLGLKLVRNIVYRQLNGTMNVVRNMGTAFTVEFKYSKESS